MHAPDPAISANPLHLYDFTHGQRRLTVWLEYGHDGRLATHAALAVPVTLQPPGEPPETEWVTVVTARSHQPRVQSSVDAANYRAPIAGPCLALNGTEFALLEPELAPLVAYLNGNLTNTPPRGPGEE